MKINNKIRFAAVGVVTLGLVAGVSMVASATTQTNGSFGAMYVADTNGDMVNDPTHVWAWDADISASGSATDFSVPLVCSPESTGVYTFMATPGTESAASTWKASSVNAFSAGTRNVPYAGMKIDDFTDGSKDVVKAAGGTYSLGVACTTDNGVNVSRVFFRTITVVAGSGNYTIADTTDVAVTPTPTPTATAPAGTSGTVALAPATMGAANGALALTVPAGAAATFSAPSLVNNKSTTVGTLGAVTVNDGRVVTRNGWDLSANVADFVNSTDATSTISKVQLGLVPSVTVAGSSATGVTAGAAQVAGSASYPAAFASGAAANSVGNSVLNAGLTFVAPQEKAAGIYTSTLTLTVVSK